ncbi:hypothetical protein DY000_02044384 [Brassica cretica]|uniref:Uncharacterized protein n=1 Tax=Brassica cretica TaxID=69181 RepID=A0ABQ7F4Z9_BRACR|nr:hypothetical protein DY000_02044384 [Brassica cretica]
MRIFQSQVTPAPTVRAAVDRQIRDRLLSIKPSPCFQPPLPQVYFAFTRPPLLSFASSLFYFLVSCLGLFCFFVSL